MKRGCHCATSRDARAQAARRVWTLCDMRPRLRPRGAGASSARRPRALCLCPSSARRPEARPGRVLPVENVLLEDAVPLPRARPGPASSRPSAWPAALPREAGPPGRPRQRPLRGDTRLPTAGSRPPTGCRPATPTAPRTRAGDGRASGADAQHVRRVEPAPPSPAVPRGPGGPRPVTAASTGSA